MSVSEIAELERLGTLGWSALHSERVGGFLAGASGAFTRRANCVATSFGKRASTDLTPDIEAVEAFYRGRDLPAVFKLTPASAPGLDESLAARGYTTDGETLVMTLDLEDGALASSGASRGDAVESEIEVIAGRVPERWFEASNTLSRVKGSNREDYAALLEHCLSTQHTVFFGQVEHEGTITSVAMASVIEETVSIAQVATDPDCRGQGLAASVLRALLFAACEHDAAQALLSVEAPNASARRLYEKLGFVERYRYWYREAPPTLDDSSEAADSAEPV